MCSLGDHMMTKMVAGCSYCIFQHFGLCLHRRCFSRHNSLRANSEQVFLKQEISQQHSPDRQMGQWMWWQRSTILNCYQKAVAPCTIPVTKASDVVIGEVWSDIKKILLIFFWVYTAFRTIYLKFQTFFYWLVVLILQNTSFNSCQCIAQFLSRTIEWCI